MSHLAEETVLAMMRGRLSADEVRAVDDHVDGCDRCRQLLVEMARGSLSHRMSGMLPVEDDLRASADDRPSLLVAGEVLASRFRIVRALGRGSMGAVYRAQDEELGVPVAVKVLTPEAARRPELVDRLRREIVLGRRVTHENVCRLYDMGTDGARRFITMELIEGETLADRISRGALSPREAFRVMRQVGDALEIAHAHGIVHRDLKPANIMLGEDGKVTVMDFGLAGDLRERARAQPELVGTPAYWSPEQARGEPATERSDVYAMAVIFCELVFGRRHERGKEPDLDGIEAVFHPIVKKALSDDPAARYQNIADVRRDLDRAWAQLRPQRPYKRRFLVAAALAGLFVGIALTVAIATGF